MKKTYIYIVTLMLAFTACEDRLNVDPTLSISEDAAISSQENIQKLLLGAYETLGNRDSHGGYLQIFSELLGMDDQVSWNGTFSEPREALTKTMYANNFLIGEMWNNAFKVVSQANLILDNIDVVKDGALKSKIEGEARFLRALCHFEMVRLYGGESKGIPLRLSSISSYGDDLTIKRSSTAEVYVSILDDLSKAIDALPTENGEFANKYAALGLQARVNLYLGKYKEALDAANTVITESGKSLSSSYADAYNHDVDNEEDIFMMQVTSQSGENQLISMYASEDNGGRGGDISLNLSFFDIFDGLEDDRSTFYYINEKGDKLTNKYTNQFGNVPMIRLPEMLLIRAECNARLNSNVGASPLDDVNAIRTRSNAKEMSTVTVADILKERQRELAFEGFAIYDVIRTKASIAGIPYNDPKLVMPIPQAEMDSNKLMEQNEGY